MFNEEIKNGLEERILQEIDNLSNLETGTEEKSRAIKDLSELHKMNLDNAKLEADIEKDIRNREIETNLENVRQKGQAKERFIKVCVSGAELILPLAFYAFWMKKGFKFEEEGTYTSTTFRSLFKMFKPVK